MSLFDSNKVTVGNFSDDYSFTNRYRVPVQINLSGSVMEDAKKNYEKAIKKNIGGLRAVKNRAQGMKYFDYMMLNPGFRVSELRKFKEQGGRIIGTFCVQVPEELIYAAGAVPIRLSCGFYDSVSVADEIMPSNICQLVRSSVGFHFLKINPFFELCDAVVIPTSCDAKKKMAEVMSNYTNVWSLELPQNRDHLEARDAWVSQVKIFKKKMERLTGKKITRKMLQQATKLLQTRTKVVREFLDIKKSPRIVINGRDTLLAIQTAFNDDIERWMRYLSALTKELSANVKQAKTIMPEGTSRIMLTGSPMIWPTWKVIDAIEEAGAVAVIDDSCAGSQYFYNTVELPDWSMKSMVYGIADKYLLPIICPIFIHSDDRIDRILELFTQYRAEGIVYHVLRLCQLMDFEFNRVSHVMKTKNIPLLKIETEYGEEDIGQIKTRIEAFIEMIKARREL